MRKPQIQPALASLTLAEREQLADWLRREHYDVVRERVNKPRPEGFGLDISKGPLQTFYAKVALLDLINSRLPPDKQISLATFETLARRDLHFLTSLDHKNLEEAHQSILDASADLATAGDNTPARLATLQRLVDFPARAEIRANKEERAQAAALRAEEVHAMRREMHAHKIAMDLRRETRAARRDERCVQTDSLKLKRADEQNARAAQRMEFTAKRFRLSVKSLAFRRKQHRDRMTLALRRTSSLSPQQGKTAGVRGASDSDQQQCDHLGPFASDLEGIRERARKQFGITPEESARRAALRKAWRTRQLENASSEVLSTYAVPLPVPGRANPSPEGTSDNSPAPLVPGNSTTFNSVPEGRLSSAECPPALDQLTN